MHHRGRSEPRGAFEDTIVVGVRVTTVGVNVEKFDPLQVLEVFVQRQRVLRELDKSGEPRVEQFGEHVGDRCAK